MLLKDIPIVDLSGIQPLRHMQLNTTRRLPLNEMLFTGIEIEAEYVEGDCSRCLSLGWTTHYDGSLRDDGMEFVLAKPLYGQALSSAIEGLYDLVGTSLTFSPSPRAGTHIHLNMTDQPFGVVQHLTAFVYCIERLLFNWADDDRAWCSYCNSLNSLPVTSLRSVLRDRDMYDPPSRYDVWSHRDNDRYYGLNVTSLWKYGTVEFRHFPTTTDVDVLYSWVDFTHAVYNMAVGNHATALSVPEMLQNLIDDPKAVLERVFLPTPAVLAGLTSLDGCYDIVKEAAEELSAILSVDTAEGSYDPVDMPEHGTRPVPDLVLNPYRRPMTAGSVARRQQAAGITPTVWERMYVGPGEVVTEDPYPDPALIPTMSTEQAQAALDAINQTYERLMRTAAPRIVDDVTVPELDNTLTNGGDF